MKHIALLTCVCGLMLLGSCKNQSAQNEQPLEVMTFNVRLDAPSDSANNWKYRKDNVCQMITYYQPDLLGMQEVRHNQMEDLAGFSIQMAYNYPFTVLLAVLLFAAGWNGSIKKHRIPWQEAGALSFAVYLVHPVYVNLLYKFVKITPFTVLEQCGVQSVAAGQAVLILLLAAFCLVVLALATATAWVLRKIPVLRKFVL